MSCSKSWEIQIANSKALEGILNFQVVHFSRPLGIFFATTGERFTCDFTAVKLPHTYSEAALDGVTKNVNDKNRYATQGSRTRAKIEFGGLCGAEEIDKRK